MSGCRFDSVSDLPEKYREQINAEIKRQNVNRAARAAVELVQSAQKAKEKPKKRVNANFITARQSESCRTTMCGHSTAHGRRAAMTS